MSLHAGQEKDLSWVQIIIAKVTVERAQGLETQLHQLGTCFGLYDDYRSAPYRLKNI